MKFALYLVFVPFLMTAAFAGEFRLGSLFQDYMVMQRDMSVPVWGEASPGDKITVEFAGQIKATEADANGRWQVNLDPMPASFESRVLKVAVIGDSSAKTLECSDVLVGEVWICSGQSVPVKRRWDHFTGSESAAKGPLKKMGRGTGGGQGPNGV